MHITGRKATDFLSRHLFIESVVKIEPFINEFMGELVNDENHVMYCDKTEIAVGCFMVWAWFYLSV